FPRLRKVIFGTGCFWHMHGCGRCRIPSSRRNYWVKKLERNAARDKRVQRALRSVSAPDPVSAGPGVFFSTSVVYACSCKQSIGVIRLPLFLLVFALTMLARAATMTAAF